MKTNILDNIFEKHGRENVLKVVADKWISDNLEAKKMSKTTFEHTKSWAVYEGKGMTFFEYLENKKNYCREMSEKSAGSLISIFWKNAAIGFQQKIDKLTIEEAEALA